MTLHLKGPVVSVETLPALVHNGINVYRPVSWIRRCEARLVLRHRGALIDVEFPSEIDNGVFLGCLKGVMPTIALGMPHYAIEYGDQLRIDLDVSVSDWPGMQDGDDLTNDRYTPVATLACRDVCGVEAIYNTLENDTGPLLAWMDEQRKAVRG